MKKVALSLFVASILIGGTSLQTSMANANVGDSNLVEATAYTKIVTVSREVSKSSLIPSSIFYSSNGYSGNIPYVSKADAGDAWLVTYRGTVSCSSNCIQTNISEE